MLITCLPSRDRESPSESGEAMRGRACHQFERPPQHSLRAEMHRPCATRLVIDNVAPEQEGKILRNHAGHTRCTRTFTEPAQAYKSRSPLRHTLHWMKQRQSLPETMTMRDAMLLDRLDSGCSTTKRRHVGRDSPLGTDWPYRICDPSCQRPPTA